MQSHKNTMFLYVKGNIMHEKVFHHSLPNLLRSHCQYWIQMLFHWPTYLAGDSGSCQAGIIKHCQTKGRSACLNTGSSGTKSCKLLSLNKKMSFLKTNILSLGWQDHFRNNPCIGKRRKEETLIFFCLFLFVFAVEPQTIKEWPRCDNSLGII